MSNKVSTLYEIMDEWEKDAEVNRGKLDQELARIGKLNAKYARYLAHHTLFATNCQISYTKRHHIKWDYLSGDLNTPEQLKENGFDKPCMKVIHTKEAKERVLDMDDELINILLKKALHEQTMEFCKCVLKELGARTYQLRAILEYERFYGGRSDGSLLPKNQV